MIFLMRMSVWTQPVLFIHNPHAMMPESRTSTTKIVESWNVRQPARSTLGSATADIGGHVWPDDLISHQPLSDLDPPRKLKRKRKQTCAPPLKSAPAPVLILMPNCAPVPTNLPGQRFMHVAVRGE